MLNLSSDFIQLMYLLYKLILIYFLFVFFYYVINIEM